MADVNMEESATVVWNDDTPILGDIHNGSGTHPRHFEHMADALDFVYAEIPDRHRPSVRINTSGHVYHYEDIERIHEARARGERIRRPEYD
ncbi:hypothetical protein [Terrihabitans sp. B22-R8]|uniref:hypothetical protein n=1 Tax=Terrihabitans sp. B22-R8 TaxID=3425128 RepID=UPI00403D2FF5